MNGDPAFDAALRRVGQLLNHHIGLRSEPTLRGRLERCVRDSAAAAGLSVDDYVDTLIPGGDALQRLVNRVTVQETAFFRHPEHFDLLARVLPDLRSPVTIWSAACSNGQEAFSLAMMLDEQNIQGSVIASDMSTAALQRTATACYTEREITGLTPHRIARYLTRQGDLWLVDAPIRARVRTLQHNLLDAIPSEVRDAQVIFCRNVLIYFSPEHARIFLDRVANAMPAASLFLGAAETIWQLSDRFDTVRTGDTFNYRRRADVRSPHGNGGERRTAAPDPARPAAPRRSALPLLRRTISRSPTRPPTASVEISPSAILGRVGQEATAAGDPAAAVVAFRKSAYLAPHDPVAHLHLGLALETLGDHPSARRAYAAARQALVGIDAAHIEHATEGYTTADLIRLIDHKQQATKR